jgi:hypothetical protein
MDVIYALADRKLLYDSNAHVEWTVGLQGPACSIEGKVDAESCGWMKSFHNSIERSSCEEGRKLVHRDERERRQGYMHGISKFI